MTEALAKLTYGLEEVGEYFEDCGFLVWGNGDYQLPLIGAIVALFMEEIRFGNENLGVSDSRFDRFQSTAAPRNVFFQIISSGRIIDMELCSDDYLRPPDINLCFVREVLFSGPQEQTRKLFSNFRSFAKRQKFEDVHARAKERLKKEKSDHIDGGTMFFFSL